MKALILQKSNRCIYLIILMGLISFSSFAQNETDIQPADIKFTTDFGEIYNIYMDNIGRLVFAADNDSTRGIVRLFDDGSQKITVGYDETDNLMIENFHTYLHPSFGASQILGDGGSPFLLASNEGDFETSGIYGDGDAVTIWAPGDARAGQNNAYLLIVDEDRWTDDTDPYDGTALIAYLNTSGVWTASDRNRKQNIKRLDNASSKVAAMKAYTYELKINQKEKDKGDVPEKSIGLIAQELIEIAPEAVSVNDYGEHFVNYNLVTPILAEALKEQIFLTEEKNQELASLKTQFSALEEKLDKVEDLDEILEKAAALEARLEAVAELEERFYQMENSLQSCCLKATTSKVETGNDFKLNNSNTDFPKLDQNHPNPFDAETSIQYYLPTNVKQAKLVITDISGKVLKSIRLEGTGFGSVQIGANELSAGSFNYSLVIDGKLFQSKKMVLTR